MFDDGRTQPWDAVSTSAITPMADRGNWLFNDFNTSKHPTALISTHYQPENYEQPQKNIE
jgi:hypothetical protein